MSWKPPPGWTVLVLKRGQTCHYCGRRLFAGSQDLYRRKSRGKKRHMFRCVDIEDCNRVREWGKEPVWRKKMMEVAGFRDRVAGRA